MRGTVGATEEREPSRAETVAAPGAPAAAVDLRGLLARTPLSNRAVARLAQERTLARRLDAAALQQIASKAKVDPGGGGWGRAHKLLWELIHTYAPQKGGSLAGSRYDAKQAGIRLDGKIAVIGNDAIARASAGKVEAVGAEVAAALAKLPDAPVPKDSGAAPASLGGYFRAEIVKWLEKFYASPQAEGKSAAFTELLGTHERVEETRQSRPNYTTCNDTTIQIFNKAAIETNVKAGAKRAAVKSDLRTVGIVTAAKDFNSEKNASAVGAWVAATPGSKERPQKGDILIFVSKNGGTLPEHIGFFYGIAKSKSAAHAGKTAQPEGTEVWITIDGGQGQKGTWGEATYEEIPDPKNPGKTKKKMIDSGYVENSGSEVISRRERYYWPETNLIEGEPNQLGKLKKLRGWVKVDKLVKESAP